MLAYYKNLIALRKSPDWKEVFVYGDFLPIFESDENVFAFCRVLGDKRAMILANFGREGATLTLPFRVRELLLSNSKQQEVISKKNAVTLKSCEVQVLSVE